MSATPLIQLDRIGHRYGPHEALRDVSVSLTAGAIGLIGQNGAGKSTLLKILLGLMRPSSGRGTVLGRELASSGRLLRLHIGFMPESDCLVPGVKGVELVSLAGELSGLPRLQARRRAHEILSQLGLEEARYRRCEEYSLGMRQRLKLASALVHDPQLLLLDEPTAGLDPEGRERMLELLESLAARHGKSLILSTHLLGDIERVCGQVVILDRGRLVGTGTIGELRRHWRDRYRLTWVGEGTRFLAALGEGGATRTDATPAKEDEEPGTGGSAVVSVPEGWTTRRLFEIARDGGVTLTELVPETEELTDLYHRLIDGAQREATVV
jgi:ABC-2 type transport system ATP-binding protein